VRLTSSGVLVTGTPVDDVSVSIRLTAVLGVSGSCSQIARSTFDPSES
jgi:hypothetical protein